MNRFEEAVVFATTNHNGQKRKINNVPFIIHPIEVATIISTITTNEDVMIAGVLHDVVEDCQIDPKIIKEKFGNRVLELVLSETENKKLGESRESSWMSRKEATLAFLKETKDRDVKILWLADKLSNIRSMYVAYLSLGEDLWLEFHQHDKRKHEWYYRTILDNLQELKDTVAYAEYERLVNLIFKN